MYNVGSGASWEEGTDYRNPEQRALMMESVQNKEEEIFVGGSTAEAGVVWKLEEKKWKPLEEVPGARGIYTMALGLDNSLWAGGAGKEKPLHLWKFDGTNWDKGKEIPECIALYSILPLSENELLLGGWNKDRRGRVWQLNENEIKLGTDLEDCFIVRDLAQIEN